MITQEPSQTSSLEPTLSLESTLLSSLVQKGKGKLRPRLNADKGGRADVKIPHGEPSVVLRKKREWGEEMPLGQAVKNISLGCDKEEITQVIGQLQSTIQPLGNIKKKMTKHLANKGKSKKNRTRAMVGTWGGGFTYEGGLALVDEKQDDTTDYKVEEVGPYMPPLLHESLVLELLRLCSSYSNLPPSEVGTTTSSRGSMYCRD